MSEIVKLNKIQPSPVDERDFKQADVLPDCKIKLPSHYEARGHVLNQGSVGSCVAHACASAFTAMDKRINDVSYEYSPGYIYANRDLFDWKGEGMYVRQALKQLNKCGDVLVDDFPYNQPYKQLKAKLTPELKEKALEHRIKSYYRCGSVDEIKLAIYIGGAVIFCVPVYTDFSKDLHFPGENEKIRGYHAMIIVGWTSDNRWIVQNSWGCGWGYTGFLYMDFDYPVLEYWGIAIDGSEKVKSVGFFKRVFFVLHNMLRFVFIHIGRFFKKIFKRKKD